MKVELLSHTSSDNLLASLPASEIAESEFLGHICFTFAIEGVSRACSHQLVRHRVASFSQQSQRYIQVKKLQDHIVIPHTITKKAEDEFEVFIKEASRAYSQLVTEGVPKEDARFILPNATETNLLMTMDGRSLMHFFGLRLCNRVQWEIRAMAEEILQRVREVEPVLYQEAGPYCVQLGKCPEGRFSCGKMAEMKTKYYSD
ncbi:thymidylate synthase, flavin-dependent [Candidatus Bathyarchaeota archaeon RBG_13_52_12]|nr:MAG: thymidylate synthase, flavin-dependent [Candidatus Bathyarchaeota archaeon RBG_13_52_12]